MTLKSIENTIKWSSAFESAIKTDLWFEPRVHKQQKYVNESVYTFVLFAGTIAARFTTVDVNRLIFVCIEMFEMFCARDVLRVCVVA